MFNTNIPEGVAYVDKDYFCASCNNTTGYNNEDHSCFHCGDDNWALYNKSNNNSIMRVKFKLIMWEDFTIPYGMEDIVLEKIKSGSIRTGNQLFEFIDEAGEQCEREYEIESEVALTPETDNGNCTIAVYEDFKLIHENVPTNEN